MKTKVSLPGPNLSKEESVARDLVFWEEFERYSIEKIEAAFKWARGNLEFFPKPVDLKRWLEAGNADTKKESFEQLEWTKATPEGREMAVRFLNEINKEIEEREIKEKQEREKRFEQRRSELKKQAKTLTEVT